MINGVETFDTGLDQCFNDYIIKQLYASSSWRVSYDEFYQHEKNSSYYVDNRLDDKFSDSGMLLCSYSIDQPDHVNHFNFKLNVLANLIFSIIIKKQTKYVFKETRPTRFLWNYYNRASTGVLHKDEIKKNFGSIVYYLNTCDASTIIEDIKINCIAGTGAIFDSNSWHRGTGPADSKNKFMLNIVFSYE